MQTSHQRGDDGAAVALVGLGIVIIALATSFWWWTRGAWGDFSIPGLDHLASLVTVGQPERPIVGHEAEPTASPGEGTQGGSARFCPPGQAPAFVLGFAELKSQLGAVMGEPVECEHPNPENGDTLQRTTTGLAIYRPSTNELGFTDGWHHWALVDGAVVAWEGPESSPPGPGSATRDADQPAGSQRARVANTDGAGVVLRSAPRTEARTAQAVAEGAEVSVLERSGADWARVRATRTGVEGWVPSRYLAPTN